jgi:signal transduction histidine kinase/CheY-like chemotaxis protein
MSGQSISEPILSPPRRQSGPFAWRAIGRRMLRNPNNQIYKTVVVVWLTLSMASVLLSAVTWWQLSRRLADAQEAVAIQSEADTVLKLLLDAETSQRGFTITGLEKFLEPFNQCEAELPAHFERLTELTRQDSQLLKHVIELRAQSEVALTYHRDVVKVRKERGLPFAADIVATDEGIKIMSLIREKVTAVKGMRATLISDEGAMARSQLLRASLTSLVAGVIGVGAGFIAFWLSRVTMQHQERERGLIEAKLQAERNSQEKTVFLANMSHEIRTPMNAILGFSELLQDDLREPKHQQYLQSIRSSAGSLLQLINDILDMSKVEAGVMELHPEPTDPREVCNFIHTVFAEPAAKKGVKLECKVAEDLPHALLLDRIRLRQVLVNLVGNAVKFTDHGNIYVRVQWEKQKTSSHIALIIEVQDTGVGIPTDKLEAIFKPFVQAGTHLEKEKQGTGLGLSIVKRLTEMMGGTVAAASVNGKGSAFSLRFPEVAISARLPVAEKLETASETNFNELQPFTLLVVDDNETNCQLVAGMFAGSHHKVFFGFNGAEGVNQARTLHPDVILLDIRMPGMDGKETLLQIRKIAGMELTPIIAFTASSLMSDDNELKERFSGYIRKPFSKRELFDELAQFFRRQPLTEPAVPPAQPTTTSPAPTQPTPPSPELIAQLRAFVAEEWPIIRDSLAINESRAFAARLEKLALKWSCLPLLAYAQTLSRHAENYAIVDLEKDLQEFSALVDRIADSASS